MDRAIIGFLAAALVGPVVFVGVYFVKGGSLNNVGPIFLFVGIALHSFGGALFFGVPAYLFLRARRWTAFWIAPLMGVVVAIMTWYVFLLWSGADLEPIRIVEGALWSMGPIGAVAGALLWLIARPDRSTTGGNTGNTDEFPKY